MTAGDCRPSVAKSDVLKRCPKQICLCEISQLKTFFFFYIMWGRVKQNMFMDQMGAPICNLCTWPFLFLYCTPYSPTPSPTNQNLTPIWRTFLLGSRSHELICRVLMGPFCLLLSFSFLCSWKTQTCWHHPTPSQRPHPLLLTPDHEAFRPLRRRGAATALWLER